MDLRVARPRPGEVVRWLGWAAVGWFAFLVYSFPAWNLVHVASGAGAGAFAGVAGVVLHRSGAYNFRLPARPPPSVWRLPWRIAADTVVVSAALVRALARGRRVEGRVRELPFSGGRHGADAIGRRGVVEFVGSVAPNVVVVAIEGDAERIVVHELDPARAPERPA